MKAREAFEKIRHQKRGKLNLRGRMIMMVSLEIVGSVLFALGDFKYGDYVKFRSD